MLRHMGLLAIAAVLVGSPALARAPQEKPLRIMWVDVEGGAATLVVTPAGKSLLMDCGYPGKRDPERIVKAARALGLKRIDHYLTSHWHTDHWGGIAELSKMIPIIRYYDHGFPKGNPRDVNPKLKAAYLKACGGKSIVLRPGDIVPIGDDAVHVRVLASHGLVVGERPGAPQTRPCVANPPHPARPDDTSDNARSLGWILSYGEFDFLDLGDLTWNVEHKLICPRNLAGIVDVYQVSHHGLSNSNNPALLKAVRPTVAVMNNGPKKGGKAAVYKWLKETPSIKDIFQLHRAVQTGPGDNAPPEFVANDGEKCSGEPVILTVGPAGKTYTIEVPSKGTKKEYASK